MFWIEYDFYLKFLQNHRWIMGNHIMHKYVSICLMKNVLIVNYQLYGHY